ncbi:hypothetical protein [Mobiluncus mulieris]|uniref:hypothetical protein n=1 Tax=Mobiluncus mulieris TaxID=2052 RepID=UPI0011C01892|nr:hypothetical protein [Mobiluncus mulieris]
MFLVSRAAGFGNSPPRHDFYMTIVTGGGFPEGLARGTNTCGQIVKKLGEIDFDNAQAAMGNAKYRRGFDFQEPKASAVRVAC